MNKNMKRILLTAVSALLLMVMTVAGTLAWLVDTSETVTNTFTVGDVQIKLDEAPVNEYGEAQTGDRVTENTYKLLPGHEYTKDPTVTVLKGSEDCYVRIIVTITDNGTRTDKNGNKLTGYDLLKLAFTEAKYWDGNMFVLDELVENWDAGLWQFFKYDDTAKTYEFRYKDVVAYDKDKDQVLDALFDTVVIPENLTNEQIAALSGVQIKLVAHAIQEDGSADAADAWTKWAN